jgi:hypothetical protein
VSKQHYYLVAGKVMFFIGDPTQEGNEAATLELNTMITCRNPFVTAKELGKAQQALQLQAVQKINEPNMVFVNVLLISVSYLGHMRPDEFHKEPKLEIAQAGPDILDKAPLTS